MAGKAAYSSNTEPSMNWRGSGVIAGYQAGEMELLHFS
jgi:hypothetical protein